MFNISNPKNRRNINVMCNQDVFITRRVSEISKFHVRQILIYLTQRYISGNLHNCRLSLLIPLPARCLHNFSLTNLTYKCCSLRRRRLFHFSFTPSQRTQRISLHTTDCNPNAITFCTFQLHSLHLVRA